jgi:hypothetical protein
MPIKLYGPGDNFDPLSSHVLTALLRKIDAAAVTISGSGIPGTTDADFCLSALRCFNRLSS